MADRLIYNPINGRPRYFLRSRLIERGATLEVSTLAGRWIKGTFVYPTGEDDAPGIVLKFAGVGSVQIPLNKESVLRWPQSDESR
jgi:hypothetical protein